MRLLLALLPSLAIPALGAGYDFSKCGPYFEIVGRRMEMLAADPESFVPELPGHRKEWASRQARISYIRANESQRVQAAAGVIDDLRKEYRTEFNELLESAADPKGRQMAIEIARDNLEDFENYPDKDPSAERKLIEALENPAVSDRELTQAARAVAIQRVMAGGDAGTSLNALFGLAFGTMSPAAAMARFQGDESGLGQAFKQRFDEKKPSPEELKVLKGLTPTPSLSKILPSPETKPGRKAIFQILQVASDMRSLSEVRQKTMEHLVGSIPLNVSLKDAPRERLLEAYEQELTQIETEIGDALEKRAKKTKKPYAREAAGQFVKGLVRDPEQRNKILSAAKSLSTSPSLTPFLKEDLARHIRFLEDFNLPPDTYFVRYVAALGQIATP